MIDPTIRIIYDGGDADHHTIDMRLLGLSLQGADRIVSDGLILLLEQRLPRRGERAPLLIKAEAPMKGSVDISGALQSAAWALPLAYPIAQDLAGDFLKNWWEAIKAKFSGRAEASEVALSKMAELNRDHLAARDASEARSIDLQHHYLDLLRIALEHQQRPIEQFIAPIVPSVDHARFVASNHNYFSINAEEAARIRDEGELTWDPISQETLRTDGFRFHTNGLSIENPSKSGYLMARVQDPRFETPENVYTEAAQRRSQIVVLARRGYKSGNLVRMDIVDFIREIPEVE
ncbi:hypothetical protein [uncultured Sphingomonas sp.]|uniref:DUF7946 domain-containing protein n=1 Tax=uncultured Sphingomonas sp. TaxID=158754 RepID=UPI00260124B4|nr:hypothetical protein [uncultured Sphingomonas sp.]